MEWEVGFRFVKAVKGNLKKYFGSVEEVILSPFFVLVCGLFFLRFEYWLLACEVLFASQSKWRSWPIIFIIFKVNIILFGCWSLACLAATHVSRVFNEQDNPFHWNSVKCCENYSLFTPTPQLPDVFCLYF